MTCQCTEEVSFIERFLELSFRIRQNGNAAAAARVHPALRFIDNGGSNSHGGRAALVGSPKNGAAVWTPPFALQFSDCFHGGQLRSTRYRAARERGFKSISK